MKFLRNIAATAILTVLVSVPLLASSSAAVPGKSEPARLLWRSRTIRLAISTSLMQANANVKFGSDVFGALKRSLDAWQDVTNVRFELDTSDRQSLSPSGVAGDGVSLITIAGTAENVLIFSSNADAEPAKTRVFYNGKGVITEADIVLNPFQQFSTDGTFGTFDLQATLTHEIGHLLGLRHSDVLGATMSDSLSRNGAFGMTDFGSRTLSDSDMAAVRELYGAKAAEDDCCASIAGKLITGGRSAKGIRVWAEESETGRVIAQGDAAADGSFRFGGLPTSAYSIFWQRAGGAVQSASPVVLKKGEVGEIEDKVSTRKTDLDLKYIGVNNQLTDLAVPVGPGGEYVIYLGGQKLDPASVKIDFSSPFLSMQPSSLAGHDFGGDISVVSFTLRVADGAPAGAYSIFVVSRDGSRAALVGALSLE